MVSITALEDQGLLITYAKGNIEIPVFSSFLSSNGIFTAKHLYKRMSLVLVDNAGLYGTKASENATKFALGAPWVSR